MYKKRIHIVELESDEFHTLLEGSVGGHTMRVVLDTGASHSCMDRTFFQEQFPEIAVVSHDGVTASVGSSDFEVLLADLPDFRLGHFHLPLYRNLALLDLSHINLAYKRLRRKPIQMILGNDFLVRHKAILDYKKQYLYFEK